MADPRPLELIVAATLLCSAAPCAVAQAPTSRLSAYLTLTTDYRSRGLSQSDGDPALQLGVDYQHRRGFFLGAWTSTVDFEAEDTLANRRRVELDLYAGYDWQLDDWGATVALTQYSYPSGPPYTDYDEISAGVRYRDRVFLTASLTSDFGARDVSAASHELTFALPVPWDMELGATIGRFELDNIPESRYTYWNIGLSKPLRRFSIDLRFHDNTYRVTNYLGSPNPEQWVLSLSYGFFDR